MKARSIGRLSMWKGDARPEEKGGNMFQKSGVSQSKGGGWGWA